MYHLSFSNLGPRTILDIKRPDRSYSEEKSFPERVCFAPTIEQCVLGMEGLFDSNKKTVFEQLLKSIEHRQQMIIADYPYMFAQNKEVFPDLNIDMINDFSFEELPDIVKNHFIRQNKKMIKLYHEHNIFSKEYEKDRNKNFFSGVTTYTNELHLNLTCYQTKSELIKPESVTDFKDTGEMWSLKPILVERIGFLSTLDLMKGKVVLVDDNVTLI